MPDARTIRQMVDERLAELEDLLGPLHSEHERLRRALESSETAAPAPGRAAAGAPGRPRQRPAAPSAPAARTRAQQAIAVIAADPGVTATDLATRIGVSRNYLYRVLPKLERDGVLKKRDGGYEVLAPPAEA